jgi:hypothetical protein
MPEHRRDRDGGERVPHTLDSKGYVRILSGPLITHLQTSGDWFVQDGAPCHTSRHTMRYLESKNINVQTSWPPRSPDLNVAELIWAYMSPKVAEYYPSDRSELCAAINAVWEAMPQAVVDRMVSSFRQRCSDVLAKSGKM